MSCFATFSQKFVYFYFFFPMILIGISAIAIWLDKLFFFLTLGLLLQCKTQSVLRTMCACFVYFLLYTINWWMIFCGTEVLMWRWRKESFTRIFKCVVFLMWGIVKEVANETVMLTCISLVSKCFIFFLEHVIIKLL